MKLTLFVLSLCLSFSAMARNTILMQCHYEGKLAFLVEKETTSGGSGEIRFVDLTDGSFNTPLIPEETYFELGQDEVEETVPEEVIEHFKVEVTAIDKVKVAVIDGGVSMVQLETDAKWMTAIVIPMVDEILYCE